MDTFNGRDKRVFARRQFNQKFSFELIGLEYSYLKSISCTGDGFDISEGGLGMTSDYSLKMAQVVKLYLPVIEKNTPLPVFAEVMWTRPYNNVFKTGLRFLYLNVTNFGLDL